MKNIHSSRFAPGKDWEVNIGLQEALTLLEPIKETYHWASTSDLIVLTSTLALSHSLGGVPELENSFCPGRVDDDSGEGWRFLEPRVAGRRGESVHLIKDYAEVMGLTNEEFAAMIGLGYSVGDTSTRCAGLFCRFQHLHKNENIFLDQEEIQQNWKPS